MSIVDDFPAIRAGLEQIENKNKPVSTNSFWRCGVPKIHPWIEGKPGLILRNKDDGTLITANPYTLYSPLIWEVIVDPTRSNPQASS
jgi:hypothetical protein